MPDLAVIRQMIDVVYVTSMKREEARELRCTALYIDPKNPDPDPGERVPAEKWSIAAFPKPLPFDPQTLAKLSAAADPRSTMLAVHGTKSDLRIWGLVDQVALHSMRYATWETWHGAAFPGVFYVTSNGVADVSVGREYSTLGVLRQDAMVDRFDDVLATDRYSRSFFRLSLVLHKVSLAACQIQSDPRPSTTRYWVLCGIASGL